MGRVTEAIGRLCMEPPFRVLARAVLGRLGVSVETRATWELSDRPAYLAGVLAAAKQASAQGVEEISVIEFGVAGGSGLLALESEATAVERATGVRIRVYGFDMGAEGLPEFIGDHRDHPDAWRPGDYPMDEGALRARLSPGTQLIIGPVAETVQTFFRDLDAPPIGFVSIDVDLYSSTRDALEIFSQPDSRMLWHVPMYFDDIEFFFNHRFAGELLAISEFNAKHETLKIDRWYGFKSGRPFPERPFVEKMYVAHDLAAVSRTGLERDVATLALDER